MMAHEYRWEFSGRPKTKHAEALTFKRLSGLATIVVGIFALAGTARASAFDDLSRTGAHSKRNAEMRVDFRDKPGMWRLAAVKVISSVKGLLFLIALAMAESLAAAQTRDSWENPKQRRSSEEPDQSVGDSNVRSKKPLRMKDNGTPVRQISPAGTVSVSLSAEQWHQIRDYFSLRKDERLDNVDFAISVGSVVPHHPRLPDLPAELTDVMQKYREKQYMLVRDQLGIAEPQSRRIVAIIPDVY